MDALIERSDLDDGVDAGCCSVKWVWQSWHCVGADCARLIGTWRGLLLDTIKEQSSESRRLPTSVDARWSTVCVAAPLLPKWYCHLCLPPPRQRLSRFPWLYLNNQQHNASHTSISKWSDGLIRFKMKWPTSMHFHTRQQKFAGT